MPCVPHRRVGWAARNSVIWTRPAAQWARMQTPMNSRPSSRRPPVEARNLADLYASTPRLEQHCRPTHTGVTQAPGTGDLIGTTCWLRRSIKMAVRT